MEISYVGSASRNQLLNGANGHIEDANPVPYGSFFTPDPMTGAYWNTPRSGPTAYLLARPPTSTTGVR